MLRFHGDAPQQHACIDGLPLVAKVRPTQSLGKMATEVENKLAKDLPIERLFEAVEKEKQLVETLNETIEEIEKLTEELEQEIIEEDTGSDRLANRWKEKYENQVRINEQLEKERNLIKQEVELERARITNGWTKYPSTYELDRDISEAELERLIRQLEMVKMNLNGQLNNLNWKMDQQSSDYHHFNDLCYNYKLEINAAKTNIKHAHLIKNAEKKSNLPAIGAKTPAKKSIKLPKENSVLYG